MKKDNLITLGGIVALFLVTLAFIRVVTTVL